MGQLFSSIFGKKAASREPKAEPFLKNGGGNGASSGGSSTITPADKAQLELKRTRDRFSKAELRLNHEMEVCIAKVKQAAIAGRKDTALQLLKVKKIKEAQRDKLRNQIFELERAANAIETEAQNAEFLKAVQQGTSALQAMQAELPLEKVQAILEDSEDAVAAAREIDEAIMDSCKAGAVAAGMSDDDVLAELNAMSAAMDASSSAGKVAAKPAAAATAAATAGAAASRPVSTGAEAAAAVAATSAPEVAAAAPAEDAADTAAVIAALPAVPAEPVPVAAEPAAAAAPAAEPAEREAVPA